MWRETYNYLGFPFPVKNYNWEEAKVVCQAILFYIQKINKNWKTNTFSTKKIPLANPAQYLTLGMDDKQIATGLDDSIKIWNRTTLEEKIVINSYVRAVCLHLSNDLLFASFSDGRVKIWSTETGELLNTIKNEIEGVVGSMCFINGMLITLSQEIPGEECCTCLTIQYLSNTGKTIKSNHALLWGMTSFGLGFDDYCIVFYSKTMASDDRMFQIRTVENLDLINSIKVPKKPRNFHYNNGLLITTHEDILQYISS